MTRKKKRQLRPWWRKAKTVRRLAIGILALFVSAVGALYVMAQGGHDGSGQFLVEPAPAFSLPTIAGDRFVSTDHVGKHNLLLYFNEGMG